ncbi:MAG: hypothetical protein IJ518_07335 [Clostridia bacterium]|nr:hypothetical protein [Clostridia bacterium]
MKEQMRVLAKQGTEHVDRRQLPEAEAAHTALFQLCDAWLAEHGEDNEVRRYWCLACNGLGMCRSCAGEQAAAREWYGRSLPFCVQLAEETGAVQAGRDLSVTYGNLGDTCFAEQDLAGARGWYEKKWETASRFAALADTEMQYEMATACCKMGLVSRGAEQLGWYRTALEWLDRLTETHPDNQWYGQMKEVCQKTIKMLENAE